MGEQDGPIPPRIGPDRAARCHELSLGKPERVAMQGFVEFTPLDNGTFFENPPSAKAALVGSDFASNLLTLRMFRRTGDPRSSATCSKGRGSTKPLVS